MVSQNFTVVVHGGAWAIPDRYDFASVDGCLQAAVRAITLLSKGNTALDAVEAAVVALEDNPVFDAGTGSVLNKNGQVEMDAAIMNGHNLEAGAVAAVQNIKNPIQLARQVMEQTPHVLLVGSGANEFARQINQPMATTDELVSEESKREFADYQQYSSVVQQLFNHDTVGAVALDQYGHLAAATSTGGISLKQPGRVGDSPLIGSGLYADDQTGAASTTGHGESIMKVLLAYQALLLGTDKALSQMELKTQGHGGVIVINADGRVSLGHTTLKMAWAVVSSNSKIMEELKQNLLEDDNQTLIDGCLEQIIESYSFGQMTVLGGIRLPFALSSSGSLRSLSTS